MAKRKDTAQLKMFHRFLDEAGDTTFYGKGKVNIVGNSGVSKVFMLGMVKFKEPIEPLREKIIALQQQVISDPYFQDIPSIIKKQSKNGYFFHAKDDIPEVRKLFYDFISGIDCSFEAVVGRKIQPLYETKHNGNESEFYADLLSHLLKNKLSKGGRLVLNVASRGKSTKNQNLQLALQKAITRKNNKPVQTQVVFNVQNNYTEPLLNISDYFCWSIQRLIERGELRYYNFLKDKISLVMDIYDSTKYQNWQNYYTPKNPLTKQNHLQ